MIDGFNGDQASQAEQRRANEALEPDAEEDYEPGDGCLGCGRIRCDCDQRYDDWRD